MRTPFIVGIGGTPSPGSSTEQALRLALGTAEEAGARTRVFNGPFLARLPLYLTPGSAEAPDALALVDAVRQADGIVIATPAYHGSVSGLVKNALDYIEATAKDDRVYLDGLPVGLVVTAYGWQATGSTLTTLRSIVHALRGWPTPLGAAINTAGGIFKDGLCTDPASAKQLDLVGHQVATFARIRMSDPAIVDTGTAPTA